MNYEEAVEELKSRGSDRKEPTLENTREALQNLERPDRDYEVILVGGTNGKGSTTEMISQMLQSQGSGVGKFTSPHLVTLRERIEVDGEIISRDEFMDLYSRLKEFDLTFFEFMTVAAYYYFSRRDVEYAVMEVGMGGRLDATNAAENSTAVITNVGKDHMKYLGNTREEIAGEKAGIIPENGLLIDNSNMEIFEKKADEQNTEVTETVDVEREEDRYIHAGQEFEIPLEGNFQKDNLETALTAVFELEGIPEDIGSALEDARCPGRMEKIDEEPGTVLDGAHNPDALEETIENFEDGFVCVFAAMETKEIERMVSIVERKASKIIVTEPDFHLAENPEKIADKVSIPAETVDKPGEALRKAQEDGEPVVVTGSLYLIGDLKKQLEQREK